MKALGTKNCPFCGGLSVVYDSRIRNDSIKRYRECGNCGARYTTLEQYYKTLDKPYKQKEGTKKN